MSLKYLSNIDLNLNQLLNVLFQQLATDPVSPAEGQVWYNTTTHHVRYYNGTTTVILYDASSANTASKLVLRDSSGNFAANVATLNSATINNTPSASTDAATVGYVQNYVQGLTPKGTARLASAAALSTNTYANGSSGVGATLTANANGALSVDGIATAVSDILLIKDESTASHNGIYTVTQKGDGSSPYIITRALDFDQAAEIAGAYIFVGSEGTANGDTGWIVNSAGPYTIGTTSITFGQFTGLGDITATAPLAKSGNVLSINYTARLVNNAGNLDLASSVVAAGTYTSVTVDTYGRTTAGADISSSTGLLTKTASGTFTSRTITAGSGVAVTNGDGVSGNPTIAVDASLVAKKYNGTITGDGSTTQFNVTHSVNNRSPICQVRDSSYNQVLVDNQGTSTSVVQLTFAVAPSNGVVYNVTIIG